MKHYAIPNKYCTMISYDKTTINPTLLLVKPDLENKNESVFRNPILNLTPNFQEIAKLNAALCLATSRIAPIDSITIRRRDNIKLSVY